MKKTWTSDQQKAISSTDGTVLVAAAAGSGKTSVLVQRVINRITNPLNPIDIDKFLIVTFTNAAAQEMKDRISESISELLLKDAKNSNLHRQQTLLKCSSIGTIHSFCNNLLKENFYNLNISPNFRIARESDMVVIKEKAMNNTFSYFLENKNPEFTQIMDIFGTEKNTDKLADIIHIINNFANSIPNPEKWFEKKLELYKNPTNAPWQKTLIQYSIDAISFVISLLEDTAKILESSDQLKKAYFSSFETDISKLKNIFSILNQNSWDECLSEIKQFSFCRLKAVRGSEDEQFKNIINLKRNYAKKIILKIKKYFVLTQEEFTQSAKELAPIVEILFDMTLYFRNQMYNLKLSKNILDFNDLEHLILKLLSDQNDNKSDIAKEISEKYSEVMVDEYQDINEVQNTIFKLITKNESNLFMVGDVKQSIYKFRQSRPKIFLDKKNKYPLYDETKVSYPCKIILGKNFRSTPTIIDGINFIFKKLMSEKVGEIPYTHEEELSCPVSAPLSGTPDISLKLIDISEDQEKNIDSSEAKEIAKIIRKMISEKFQIIKGDASRPVTYGDFCVILRSSNAHAHIYARELQHQGIPAWSETNEKFLDTPEISTMLSLLQIIDNPINDIPLISCMMSPLFGFTVDDLSSIRQAAKGIPFYFALKQYAETNPNAQDFINQINRYRNLSGTMSCSELIDYIYQETDYPFMCVALPKGEIKKSNLFLLRDYAKKFEDEYNKGLKGFLDFIENIKRKNADLPSAAISSENDNTVKIMSIHKSKGLEFPICILAGCSRKFAGDAESVILHPELGLGFKMKNHEGTLQYDNLIFQSISLKNKLEDVSEELRVLYVAMTRAKQKLIIIASLEGKEKIVEKSLLLNQENTIPAFLVQNSTSFLEWIVLCLSSSSIKNELFRKLNVDDYFLPQFSDTQTPLWDLEIINSHLLEEVSDNPQLETQTTSAPIDPQLLQKIETYTSYKYPYENLSELPLKIAASKLSGSGEWKDYFASSKPAFLSNTYITPTSRGNAIHKFLYFVNFAEASQNLDAAIDSLKNRGLLSTEEINLLNKGAINKFINSPLCQRIMKSPKVLREYRFSVNLPIKETPLYDNSKHKTCSENLILVQGAMDCVFLEDNEYVIIDYKTDKTDDISKLYQKYSNQLQIYKSALSKIHDLKVKETGIYSFKLSEYYSEP